MRTAAGEAGRRQRRRTGLIAFAAGLGLAIWAPVASAARIELTLGSAEPVESVATQLGAVVTDGGGDELFLHVKPTGGLVCGANPEADDGESVISYGGVTNETNPVQISQNWTFRFAGSYRVCAWLTHSGNEVPAKEELTLTVRPPHLSLSVSAPAAVSENQTFQVATTAQSEAPRPVYEYAEPNTGRGCPANAEAASETSGRQVILSVWNVTGGPFTETQNVSIEQPGGYLICAYFEYEGSGRPPELAASTQTVVVPPCVVPSFVAGASLASVETALRAASCTVGRLHRTVSSVRRGGVLGLSPRPGTTLPSGAAVAIDVSAGPPCVVPAVRRGASVGHVERLLSADRCGYVLAHTHSRHVRRGAVVGLGSPVHAHLFPGTKVRVVVSSGR